MSVLPETWAETTIGKIFDVVGGGTPSTKETEYWGGATPWVTSADMAGIRDLSWSRTVTPKGIENSTTNLVPKGSLLVATRVGLGKISVAPQDICFSQDVQGLVIADSLLDQSYALHYLSQKLQELKFEGQGTTISGLTKKKLKDAVFPLAPLGEQKRIVAKIEELFSELDKGIEALKTAQAQLKVYRQALLKHAFEGKLTADWREANKDKLESADKLLARIKTEREAHYQQQLDDWKQAVKDWETNGKEGKKPTKPKKVKMLPDLDEEVLSNLPNPPVQWAYVKWEDILDYDEGAFRRGPFGSTLKKAFFVKEGYKVYEQYCPINDDCSFERYYITPEKYAELKAFWVKSGDFLISCSGVTLGRITQVPSGYKEGVINQAILRIRLNQSYYCSDFFKDLFRSSEFQKKFFDKSTGSAIPNVKGVKELKVIPVPLCSLDEQLEITARLNAKLSVLDRMEADIETQLKKSEALRQSILKKAFSGQLVPQDPTDEPAAKLLERIKAEKAKAAALKKPKRKKAS